MQTKSFEAEYQKLNPAQREAVDALEGPVMVIAGPGTGKTQILTLRIANLLRQTDVAPANILALTFTESGVRAMRRRLAELIGPPAYTVNINTFHGFCNDIIKNYPESFPRIIGAEHITEVESVEILEKIVEAADLNLLRPFGDAFHYLKDIARAISDLKREAVAPDDFDKLLIREIHFFENTPDLRHEHGVHRGKMKGKYLQEEKTLNKNRELAKIYRAYEETIRRQKVYDYSDMIMEVVRELSANPELLLILQETYQYVLVDEHQDTNNAQNKILELLVNFHSEPNLFVVGDEKQAIFRFQGASLENFLYFKHLYPSAKLIVLTENYRSTQTILDSAHSILPSPTRLNSQQKTNPAPIQLYAMSAPAVELYFIAQDIKTKIESGVEPQNIAVLYRENRDATPLARMLQKIGIPFVIESDHDLLADPEIKKLRLLMKAIVGFGHSDCFMEALHIDFLGVDPLDVYKLIAAANRQKISIYELARQPKILAPLFLENPKKLTACYELFKRFAVKHRNQALTECFEAIIHEFGFLGHLLSTSDAAKKLQTLHAFFDEAVMLSERRKNASLQDFVRYLETLENHQLVIKKNFSGNSSREIRLMTAHRSKGQEFERVYLINAFDGHWGNKRQPQKLRLLPAVFLRSTTRVAESDPNDDERRLFYVALTRAKKSVTITYAKESSLRREQLPSQFIGEINSDLLQIADTTKIKTEFSQNNTIAFLPTQATSPDIRDAKFIKELFQEKGLSATALNHYLACPWQYFYTDLLKIPKAAARHQLYGIAIHAALKDFFDAKKNQEPDKQFLLKKFEYHLNEQATHKNDLEIARTKGFSALSGYFDQYLQNSPRHQILTEYRIIGVPLTDDIKLNGTLDKIEFLDDGNRVVVVDYKTGSIKTKGEIEGTTQSSNGDIKRQLTFYNVLLNHYEAGKKFKMVAGEIDFIEPDEKGRYHRERLVIEPAECTALIDLIKKTAEEIMTFSFANRRCDEPKCEFCALREVMK